MKKKKRWGGVLSLHGDADTSLQKVHDYLEVFRAFCIAAIAAGLLCHKKKTENAKKIKDAMARHFKQQGPSVAVVRATYVPIYCQEIYRTAPWTGTQSNDLSTKLINSAHTSLGTTPSSKLLRSASRSCARVS